MAAKWAQTTKLGFKVISATDGEEALALFKEQALEIGCVLLDLTMPRKSGVSTLHGLKAIRPDIPVILCSGYSEDAAIRWQRCGRIHSEALSAGRGEDDVEQESQGFRLSETRDRLLPRSRGAHSTSQCALPGAHTIEATRLHRVAYPNQPNNHHNNPIEI